MVWVMKKIKLLRRYGMDVIYIPAFAAKMPTFRMMLVINNIRMDIRNGILHLDL